MPLCFLSCYPECCMYPCSFLYDFYVIMSYTGLDRESLIKEFQKGNAK